MAFIERRLTLPELVAIALIKDHCGCANLAQPILGKH